MSTGWKPRGTWRDKLEKKQEPKIVDTPPKMQKFGAGKMLVPTPSLVDAVMQKVPSGKLLSVNQIRQRLAADFNADSTCPLTTGIFVRISAEAAEEYMHLGRKDITPYWRVIKNDGSLNEKFPGGVEAQARRLENEGHTIEPVAGRKPPKVKDFEKSLFQL